MRHSRVVLDPIKQVLRVFWMASKTFLEKHVSREFITMMLLWRLEINIRGKHCILIRRRFYWVLKPLHVMFYWPFDRSMGLWIINEFLKLDINIDFFFIVIFFLFHWWFISFILWNIDVSPCIFINIVLINYFIVTYNRNNNHVHHLLEVIMSA